MTNPDARTGIFSWSKATNKITCIANDNDTAVPGLTDDWRFTAFGGVSVSPSGAVLLLRLIRSFIRMRKGHVAKHSAFADGRESASQ